MKLNLSIILDRLPVGVVDVSSPEADALSFSRVRMAVAGQPPEKDTLYILTTKQPQLPGLYAKTAGDCNRLVELVQGIIDLYSDWHERLTGAILQRCPMQEILDIATEMLVNPVAIIDSSFATILYSGRIRGDITGSVWDSVLHNGYFRVEEYSRQLEQKLRSATTNRRPQLYDPGYANHERHVTVPLFCEGRYFASIGSCDINGPFTRGQIATLELIRDILEYAFERGDEFHALSEEDTYYVDRLIRGYSPEDTPLIYYLRQRNWQLHENYLVLSIQNRQPSSRNEMNEQPYSFRIKRLFPDSMVSFIGQTMVVVLHQPQQPFGEAERKGLAEFLSPRELCCGVSAGFSDFRNLEYAYRQSRIALQQAQLPDASPTQTVFYFLSSYKNLLLESLYGAVNIKAFCHPRLLEYHQQKGAAARDAFATVETFLTCGCNITQTAEALNIHRNTLQYRLEKINRELGIDLKTLDEDERFYLLFSCVILAYLAAKQEVPEA